MTQTLPVRARPGFHRLRVARIDRLCDDAVAVTFAVPTELGAQFDFRPGQSLTLLRQVEGRDERRSYSVCAPAGAAPRIGVREVADGAVSGWLVHEVRPGDEVEVGPPTGTFSPDLDAPAHHVLIAAGSGITPVLSIAASVLADPRSEATLIYANRRTDSVMFADEVADLKDAHPTRFRLVHVLSREPQEVELFSGRLDADKLRDLLPVVGALTGGETHYWLCGPFGLTSAAAEVLGELGVPADHVHRELFYVEPDPPEPARHEETARDGAEVTVVLDGRASTVTVETGVTVLDAAQRVRPDLPFACKGGVCGTCRARVIDGEIRMRRNFALEPAEVDAGFVLTCQSLCESATARVDYDA